MSDPVNPSSTPHASASAAPATTPPTAPPTIKYDDFTKLELRVATILECRPHEKGDRLLVLQLDMGNGERRQICAGIRQHYAQPEALVGKQIVVVANLAPRTMLGEVSQGMLLAATDASNG